MRSEQRPGLLLADLDGLPVNGEHAPGGRRWTSAFGQERNPATRRALAAKGPAQHAVSPIKGEVGAGPQLADSPEHRGERHDRGQNRASAYRCDPGGRGRARRDGRLGPGARRLASPPATDFFFPPSGWLTANACFDRRPKVRSGPVPVGECGSEERMPAKFAGLGTSRCQVAAETGSDRLGPADG